MCECPPAVTYSVLIRLAESIGQPPKASTGGSVHAHDAAAASTILVMPQSSSATWSHSWIQCSMLRNDSQQPLT